MRHRPTTPSSTRSTSTRPTRPGRPGARTATAATAVLLALGALTACGGDDAAAGAGAGSDTGSSVADAEADLAAVQEEAGVPQECREAFPVALAPADLADLTLVPADWPAAPAGATLCQTSATGDGTVELAEFATTGSATEVLDAVEASLPAGYEVERGDEGLGEQLSGASGAVFFEVTTRDGAFTVTFSS